MTISIQFGEKTVRVAVEINGEIESAMTYLPEREWVGLTDEEIAEFDVDPVEAKALIQKLKDKNT